MLATSKQKKIINLILVSMLLIVILTGIGLGLYFIISKSGGSPLSMKEKEFGNSINKVVNSKTEESLNVSYIDERSSVVLVSNDYLVTCSDSGVYSVFSVEQNESVDISFVGEFESIDAIYGSLAIVKSNDEIKVCNLKSSSVLFSLVKDSDIKFFSKYITINVADIKNQEFLTQNNLLDSDVIIIDIETSIIVKSIVNPINLNVYDNFIVVSYIDRTEVINLNVNDILMKSFSNQGIEATSLTSNLISQDKSGFYFMNLYHKVMYLGSGRFLVEKAEIVNNEEYDIESSLEDGTMHKYKISYLIYDAINNIELALDSEGLILQTSEVEINGEYIAIISKSIVEKKSISVDSKISYYLYDFDKNGIDLSLIVSYDYNKFGKIVGFDGINLITSGGSGSSLIDFKGNAQALAENAYKLSSDVYDKAYIVTNELGEKLILDKYGKLLVENRFIKLTSFVDGSAIGYDGSKYYSISNNGHILKIDNFASEFNDYVFLNLGYYFTRNGDSYNVYKFDGTVKYEAVDVSLSYDILSSNVLMRIISNHINELIKVNPNVSTIAINEFLIKYNLVQSGAHGLVKSILAVLPDYDGGEIKNETGEVAYNKFSISVIDGTPNQLKITLNKGYMLTGFTLYEDVISDSTYTQTDSVVRNISGLTATEYIILLNNDCEYFKLENVEIIDSYSIFNLKDYNGDDLGLLYYFENAEGYKISLNGSDKTDQIGSLPTRTGYNFNGYYYNNENLVLDSEGYLKNCEGLFIDLDPLAIESYELVAKYDAEDYTIWYVSENSTLFVTTDVVYDGLIPSLFDITSNATYNKIGYTFNGWYSTDTFETSSKYEEGMIYNVAGDVTLYAKWTPNEYTLTFDSNASAYNGVSINGYTYNINNVTVSGVDFTTQTKTVVYDSQYGLLPKLEAKDNKFTLDDSDDDISYIFLGWFEKSTIDDKGGMIEESDIVSILNNTTIYAHYARSVYYIDVEITGENNAVNGSGETLINLDDLSYVGSDISGVKLSEVLSTSSGTWVKTGGKYRMYTINKELLELTIDVGEGYFISSIKLTKTGSSEESLTGSYDSSNSEASLTGTVNDMDYNLSNDNVLLSFTSVDNSTVSNTVTKFADLIIEFSTITYLNKFNVNDKNKVTISGAGSIIDDTKYHSNSYYGSVKTYNINPKSLINKDGISVHITSLSKIIIDGEELSFGYEFTQDANKGGYYTEQYILTGNAEEIISWNSNTRTQFVKIGDVSLYLVYDFVNNKTASRIEVVSSSNHEIYIEYVYIQQSSVSLGLNDNSLFEVNASYSKGQGYADETVSGLTKDVDKYGLIEWHINPKNHAFIYNLEIIYGETTFAIATPNAPTHNLSNKNVEQKNKYIANSYNFTTSGAYVGMYGAGVSFVWNSSTRGFTISATNISEDLQINISAMKFNLVTVDSEGVDNDSIYELKIRKNGTLQPLLITENAGLISSAGFYKIHKDGTSIYSYIFAGVHVDIEKIYFNLPNTGDKDYVIDESNTKPIKNEGVFDLEITNVEIDMSVVDSYIKLLSYGGTLSIESYVSVGNDGVNNVYEKEPIEGFDILIDLTTRYYDQDDLLQVWAYDGVNSSKLFKRNYISFELRNVVGYYYKKIVVVDNNSEETIVWESTGEESVNCTFTIEDLNLTQFTLKVYQNAIEYDVKYELYTKNLKSTDEVTGSTTPTRHMYNVWSDFADNGFNVPGYMFIGYNDKNSLYNTDDNNGSVEAINIKYPMPDRKLLTENLSDINDSEVIIYAVFKIQIYNVTFDYSIRGGSTLPTEESTTVNSKEYEYKNQFVDMPNPIRDGYSFGGWYTSVDFTRQILATDEMDANLIEELELEGNEFTLYAKYDAKNYTIVIDKNDKNSGFGSTVSTGAESTNVVFDSEFGLLFDDLGQTRKGYTFLGYKGKKLGASDALANTDSYIGLGDSPVGIVDKAFLDGALSRGITVDHENQTISTLYAVWKPLKYTVLINLNLDSFYIYGRTEEDCQVSLKKFDGTEIISTSQSYIAEGVYSFEISFDEAFDSTKIPNVEFIGYNFNGFFTDKSGGTMVAGSIIDDDLFDLLSYVSVEGGTQESLSSDPTSIKFSIYAQYEYNNYSFEANVNALGGEVDAVHIAYPNIFNFAGLDNVCNGISEVDDIHYGDDLVFEIYPTEGKYVKTITLNYVDKDGNSQEAILEFVWDNTKKIKDVNGTDFVDALVSVEAFGDISYVADAINVAYVTYGVGSPNACRMVLQINAVKTDFTAEATIENQTYEIKKYNYFYNPNGYTFNEYALPKADLIETINVEYEYVIATSDIMQEYKAMYKFVDWKYGEEITPGEISDPISGTVVLEGDVVAENKVFVAVYELTDKQGIEFYYFTGTGYEKVQTYIAWELVGGRITSGAENGYYNSVTNTLNQFPSPTIKLWPDGTVLSGYVVVDDGADEPSGDYYMWGDEITQTLQEFDANFRVEGLLRVYAVYNAQDFGLTVSSDGLYSYGKLSMNVYDYKTNGEVFKYDYNDVWILGLTDSQYINYMDNIDTETKEVALRIALDGDYTQAEQKILDGSETNLGAYKYYFAVIFKTNDAGEKYIWLSSQYFEAS